MRQFLHVPVIYAKEKKRKKGHKPIINPISLYKGGSHLQTWKHDDEWGNGEICPKCWYYMSLVLRKPDFCICKNKTADKLCSNRTTDQRLCFSYMDRTIPVLPKAEISSHLPWLHSLVCVVPGLKPRSQFSQNEAHITHMSRQPNDWAKTWDLWDNTID